MLLGHLPRLLLNHRVDECFTKLYVKLGDSVIHGFGHRLSPVSAIHISHRRNDNPVLWTFRLRVCPLKRGLQTKPCLESNVSTRRATSNCRFVASSRRPIGRARCNKHSLRRRSTCARCYLSSTALPYSLDFLPANNSTRRKGAARNMV